MLFSNCESNTEDIIPDPIIETPIEETPALLTSLSFEETYVFETNLLGGPHKENNLIVYCISFLVEKMSPQEIQPKKKFLN